MILQYGPGADYVHGYQYFETVSRGRIFFGHFLSVLAAPFYLIGYWHLARRLDVNWGWSGKVFFALGAYGFIIGAVWMGERAFLALTVQQIKSGLATKSLLEDFSALNEPLVNVLRTAISVLSLLWLWGILRGHSTYPKWMAVLSPAVILALIFGFYLCVPSLGGFLLPNAMNVAHILIFSLSLWTGRESALLH